MDIFKDPKLQKSDLIYDKHFGFNRIEFNFDNKKFRGEVQETVWYQTTTQGRYLYITGMLLQGLDPRKKALVYSKFAREAAAKGYDGLLVSRASANDIKPLADSWKVVLRDEEFEYRVGLKKSLVSLFQFTDEMKADLVPKTNAAVLRKPDNYFHQVGAGAFLKAFNNEGKPIRVQSELGDIEIQIDVGLKEKYTDGILDEISTVLLIESERLDRPSFKDVEFDSTLRTEIQNYPVEVQNDILNHLFNEASADVYRKKFEQIFAKYETGGTVTIRTPQIRSEFLNAHQFIKRLEFADSTEAEFQLSLTAVTKRFLGALTRQSQLKENPESLTSTSTQVNASMQNPSER